jgi:hypothetical protein
MSRLRKVDTDLPPRVYPKHGRFWYVLGGKWTGLSTDRATAIEEGKRLNEIRHPGWSPALEAALGLTFKSRRSNAKSRSIEFSIGWPEVLALASAARWRCAVTRIPFSLEKTDGRRRAPFCPSIDRIKCGAGYVSGNVRVVCLATNFAMNEWGDAVMQKLAEGWLKAEFQRRVLDV